MSWVPMALALVVATAHCVAAKGLTTVLTEGELDQPLTRVPYRPVPLLSNKECFTIITKDKYDCKDWKNLVTLRVNATSFDVKPSKRVGPVRAPPEISIAEGLSEVRISGCLSYLSLEHACVPLARARARARAADDDEFARRYPRAPAPAPAPEDEYEN